MKELFIETDGVKRKVPLPAQVCVTRETAYKIREAMDAFIGSEASYGWITIHADEAKSAGPNTKPLEWHEAGFPVSRDPNRTGES